jgi:hypothetical protein
LLIDPPFEAVPRLIEENRRKLDRDDVRIGGDTLSGLRYEARTTLCGLSPKTPLILTGHQPELFHPGVWVKNFAAAGLETRVGGRAAFLTVDNDTVHSTTVAVPHFDPAPKRVRIDHAAFDQAGADVTYEFRTLLDFKTFSSFGDRQRDDLAAWPFKPLLADVWKFYRWDDTWEKPKGDFLLVDLLTQIRQTWEEEFGLNLGGRPVSHYIHSYPWHVFVDHLLADAARFAAVHNTALAAYRRENKLRSRTHPFPDLAPNEAPFWVLDDAGNRKRCFVPFTGDPKALRPRALTLTLFARLILGDFFIHGIGGGKYDEVTDRIIRDYFGIDPPAFQVVSGTLHLPFPAFPHSADDVKRLECLRRDIDWNPHRHLTAEQRARPEVAELLRRRDELNAQSPTGRPARRQHFQDRRAVVDALRPLVAGRVAAVEGEMLTATAEARANAVLFRRDYPWVLFPRDVLVPFLKGVQDAASGRR